MNTAFASHYLPENRLSDSDQRLQDIAQQYVSETEAYDRTVCTGPILHDGVMPATRHQFALVNRNARQTMDRLCIEHPEFSQQQIRRAAYQVDCRGGVS